METLMQVNSARVRQLRESKAWSQEHLASCAGVSLRTVQRMEAEGRGSHETVMALASALGVTPADLLGRYMRSRRGARWVPIAAASTVATVALGILTLALVPRVSTAESIRLQISGKHGQDVFSAKELVTAAGKPVEIRVAKDYRLVVVPIVEADKSVLLELKLYIYRKGEFELAGSPSLLVANQHTAAVELSSSDHPPAGELPYRFEVTPRSE